jgi:aspartate ammonia-lyase
MKYRIEHDLLGQKEVPVDAYYGIHTLRAYENFNISGQKIHREP